MHQADRIIQCPLGLRGACTVRVCPMFQSYSTNQSHKENVKKTPFNTHTQIHPTNFSEKNARPEYSLQHISKTRTYITTSVNHANSTQKYVWVGNRGAFYLIQLQHENVTIQQNK